MDTEKRHIIIRYILNANYTKMDNDMKAHTDLLILTEICYHQNDKAKHVNRDKRIMVIPQYTL